MRLICEDNMVILSIYQRIHDDNLCSNLTRVIPNRELNDELNEFKLKMESTDQNLVEFEPNDIDIKYENVLFWDSLSDKSNQCNSPIKKNEELLLLSAIKKEPGEVIENKNENLKRKRGYIEHEHHCSMVARVGRKEWPDKRLCAERCVVEDRGVQRATGGQPISSEAASMSERREPDKMAAEEELDRALKEAKKAEMKLRNKLLQKQLDTNKCLEQLIAEVEKTKMLVKTRQRLQARRNQEYLKDIQQGYQLVKRKVQSQQPLSEKGKMTTTTRVKGKKDQENEDSTASSDTGNVRDGGSQEEQQRRVQRLWVSRQQDEAIEIESVQELVQEKESIPIGDKDSDSGIVVQVVDSSIAETTSQEKENNRNNPRYNLRKNRRIPIITDVGIIKAADHVIAQENRVVPQKFKNYGQPLSSKSMRRHQRWAKRDREAEYIKKVHYKTRKRYSEKAKQTREEKRIKTLKVHGSPERDAIELGSSNEDEDEPSIKEEPGTSRETIHVVDSE
ncbi:uncharacterized protein LOC107269159 [Cephus cinctus]|uniref:Uncharacterized protein LOC107269159 n=1 Tax=Cephus cinctus TaxID=211228 RepID=A0AAJ7FLU1_CEPCN|nr:uncharacterized protein LOC107269159 [Cephus cinctus]XP_024942183.1 uncharacterized protein LOC107269159 [Cephus cinctus]